jgi:predicted Zn-dependent protease
MPTPICRRLLLALLLATARLGGHPDTAEARAELDRLIAEFPAEPDFYLHRAELLIVHRDWSGAEADLHRAEQLAPRSPRVAVWRAQIRLVQDDLAGAKKSCDAALALAPGDAEALVWRARVRTRLGDAPGAHADYSAAIRALEAPSPDLFLARAALPVAPELALAGIEEGLTRLGPAQPLVERALALELRLRRTDAALARLDAIAATAERKDPWLKRRGDILAAAGRMTEARAAYAAALAAIAALPEWLREAPDTAQLTTALHRLANRSS